MLYCLLLKWLKRKKMISEIYILRKCLTDRDRSIKAGFITSEAQRKQINKQPKGISDIKRLKLLIDEKRKEKGETDENEE